MKNKRYPVLLLAFVLLLSACAKNDGSRVLTTCETRQTESETVPVCTEETETVPITTVPTNPLHSEYYHPDYTYEQIRTYFEEVVLHAEYSDGVGNPSLVQKWENPVHYRISGRPTEEDLAVLEAFFEELNRISGFPGILEAAEGETEQLRISFLEPDIFRASYSSVVGGEDATGATEYWYYTDTNEIHSARIGYRTDIDQSIRNSILIEEIVNTLGISDTELREDSITYQHSDFNTSLSQVDRILLNLLYHPDVHCGMDGEDCAAVLRQLYY